MSTTTIPTFRELAAEVLNDRDEQGVRGITRERSRYRVHIESAPFIDMPITEIAPRHIRMWLRDMAKKDAILPPRRERKKLDRATINRAFSLVSVICTEASDRTGHGAAQRGAEDVSVHVDDRRLYTREQLYVAARAKRAIGHDYIQLVASRLRKPSAGRIRIFPGTPVALFGRVVGEISRHRYLIDVLIADVEKAERAERTVLPSSEERKP